MDQPAECVICKLLAGELEVSMVHRDLLCSVFMDINPVNRGHVLVVPNRHTAEVTGLTAVSYTHLTLPTILRV